MEDYSPDRGTRCGACRLIVGPGRAVRDADGTGVSMAAGALASFARRAAAAPVEPSVVTSAVLRLADDLGIRPNAVRLTHYRHALASGFAGPTLDEVLATFRTWGNVLEAVRRE